ncbi:hypothetical protein MNBD_GAMMA13-1937 [hydrothermal vent metagenome]|uniref:Nucleotidyltransferase family protein n=1 Tax=hydrothermal vent metagenome TaxID=652676 RepID=A0A3B0YXZ3_9ZZZZ
MNPRLVALEFIGNCLSLESPERYLTLQQQMQADALSWEAVVELANNHLLAPALWISLQKKGLSRELPSDLANYLSDLHGLSIERNIKLREQLLEAVGQLNQSGITPVLLKGAAHLVSSMYADPGVRIMSDIDVLVDRQQTDAAYDCLLGLDYKPDESCLDDYGHDHHHCPPLFRPGDYATVEIHRNLMDGQSKILSASEALADARAVNYEGLAMKVLSPTHRILHNLVHSQLVDAHYMAGVIPLRSLNEVAVESLHASEPPDWKFISGRLLQNGHAAVLHAYLYMANSLFDMPWPPNQRTTLGARLYSVRCKRQLAWDWFTIWGIRWGRFSATNIRKLYPCGDGVIELNRARAHYARQMLVRYVTRIFAPASSD